MKPKLFILKMPFVDSDIDNTKNTLWFCAHCALIEAALQINPLWRQHIEVSYIDFPKPRKAIVDILGADRQWLPALVISSENVITDPIEITSYLAHNYGGAAPHP